MMWRFWVGLPLDAAKLLSRWLRWRLAPPASVGSDGFPPRRLSLVLAVIIGLACGVLILDRTGEFLANQDIGPGVGTAVFTLFLTVLVVFFVSALSLLTAAGGVWPERRLWPSVRSFVAGVASVLAALLGGIWWLILPSGVDRAFPHGHFLARMAAFSFLGGMFVIPRVVGLWMRQNPDRSEALVTALALVALLLAAALLSLVNLAAASEMRKT